MGALTGNRKRGDYCKSRYSVFAPFDYFRLLKKRRLSGRMDQKANFVVSRINRYPDSKTGFLRNVHAPVRRNRFGFSAKPDKAEISAGSKECSVDKMRILCGNYESTKNLAMKSLRYISEEDVATGSVPIRNETEVMEIAGGEDNQVDISDDLSVEEVEIVENQCQSLNSSVVSDLSTEDAEVDLVEKMMDLMQLRHEHDDTGIPAHRKLYDSAGRRNNKLNSLASEINLTEKRRQGLRLLQPQKDTRKAMRDVAKECFVPLSEKEMAEVTYALSKSNRGKVLVSHESSNIDITGEKLYCLRPGGWLNDEVINLYIELLKERGKREPQKFLKCHFFNTFFYKKLIAGRGGYDFQSVRRWTTPKRIGHSLLDCDKIFVPIHKVNHWCLAVINQKDEKFQYLDSLKGYDAQVMKVLSRYLVDEVKDKSDKDVNVSSWEEEFVEDLPQQHNGFDCGIFMLKYADFYSRDTDLCFSQEDMPYFRRRTIKEILRLKAD